MTSKYLAILLLIFYCVPVTSQHVAETNKTDQSGKKQGPWIKKYPGGTIQYEGVFQDDHPVGEFRRYYENHALQSVLIYSLDGRTADATIYHANGYIASKGRYSDQMKEGRWKFYSEAIKDYLLSEEDYSKNLRHGISIKYYPDGIIAEKLNFANDMKEGEWLQFHESGKLFLKSNFTAGNLNGKFEIWFENGKLEYSGLYRNNLRDGHWTIYQPDGRIRYELNYVAGITKDRQMEIDASERMDSLEKNKDRIADPEKTRIIRK
jgi:antitoxin component YwqK of YwqJK toxin-antitoxin module